MDDDFDELMTFIPLVKLCWEFFRAHAFVCCCVAQVILATATTGAQLLGPRTQLIMLQYLVLTRIMILVPNVRSFFLSYVGMSLCGQTVAWGNYACLGFYRKFGSVMYVILVSYAKTPQVCNNSSIICAMI